MISPIRSGIPSTSTFRPLPPVTTGQLSSTAAAPLDAFEPAVDSLAQPQEAAPADDSGLLQQLIAPLITALLSAMKSIFEGLANKLTGKQPSADSKVGKSGKSDKKSAKSGDQPKADKKAKADKKRGGKKADKKDKKDKGEKNKGASGYHGKGAEYLKSRGSHTVGQVHGLSAAEAFIIQHESGGNPRAKNPSSGAFGIWQGLGSTLTSEAKKFGFNPHTTNVNEQLIMFRDYVKNRYGTPEKAMAFWKAHNWY
jgi:hypothetical protein